MKKETLIYTTDNIRKIILEKDKDSPLFNAIIDIEEGKNKIITYTIPQIKFIDENSNINIHTSDNISIVINQVFNRRKCDIDINLSGHLLASSIEGNNAYYCISETNKTQII